MNHLAAHVDKRHAASTQGLVAGLAGSVLLDVHLAVGDAVLGKELAGFGAVAAPVGGVEHDLAAARRWWVDPVLQAVPVLEQGQGGNDQQNFLHVAASLLAVAASSSARLKGAGRSGHCSCSRSSSRASRLAISQSRSQRCSAGITYQGAAALWLAASRSLQRAWRRSNSRCAWRSSGC